MARRRKKGKSPVHIVMMKITDDSWDVKGKIVQVEVRAQDERQARSEALSFARSVYSKDGTEKQGYHIKAVSLMSDDGLLENNDVLEYKPDEVLTRGKLPTEKVHAGSTVPKSKAVTVAGKEAQTKPAPAAAVVSRWARLDNPLTQTVIAEIARGNTVHEYHVGNVRKVTGGK
jgi:hypothetical protein